jgi:hypothetical protein
LKVTLVLNKHWHHTNKEKENGKTTKVEFDSLEIFQTLTECFQKDF